MLPVMRDPDGFIYYKEEVGGLVMGGFEPRGQALEGRPDSDRPSSSSCSTRTGSSSSRLMTERDPPHALPGDRGDQDAAQRAGELHARRQLHPRRGARAAQLLRLRRLQFGGHRQLGRRRAPDGRVDHRRRSAQRPVGRGHPPLRPFTAQPQGAGRAHRRNAGPALRDALAAPGAGERRGRCAPRRCTTCWRHAAPSSAAKNGWERANYFRAPRRSRGPHTAWARRAGWPG